MYNFIKPTDTALLLIDHQSGLLQTVKDIDIGQMKANALALAKAASLLSMPVITTASAPDGPNGPLISEVASCPEANYVPRHGEINAWDAPDFVKAVESTGRKTLIIAGVWTSVCVAFPALSALAQGYRVYAVIDASGDVSTSVSQISVARLINAGVTVTTTNAMVAELQKPGTALRLASLQKSIAVQQHIMRPPLKALMRQKIASVTAA